MFTDQNDLFLKNFQSLQDPRDDNNDDNNCFTPVSAPAWTHSSGFDNDDAFYNADQQNQKEKAPENGRRQHAKMNTMSTYFSRTRKYSETNIQMKDIRQDDQVSITAKSQASVSDEQDPNKKQEHVQKSDKSIGGKSNYIGVAQIQCAFMRKIRNLQARIKNVNLNYQTLMSKTKKQYSQLDKVHKEMKLFLETKHPQIFKDLQIHMKNLQKSVISSFGGSSSSSSVKNNEQWMPIFSKIQELRFDGQKMCETIKNYQQALIKKQQIEQQLRRQQNKEGLHQDQRRKFIIRKYSIPVQMSEYKRQSPQRAIKIKQIAEKSSQENMSGKMKKNGVETSQNIHYGHFISNTLNIQ